MLTLDMYLVNYHDGEERSITIRLQSDIPSLSPLVRSPRVVPSSGPLGRTLGRTYLMPRVKPRFLKHD